MHEPARHCPRDRSRPGWTTTDPPSTPLSCPRSPGASPGRSGGRASPSTASPRRWDPRRAPRWTAASPSRPPGPWVRTVRSRRSSGCSCSARHARPPTSRRRSTPSGSTRPSTPGCCDRHGDAVTAALDLRPHADEHGSWWVLSDLEVTRGRADPDDVRRAASTSWARARPRCRSRAATVRRPVATLLDLGAGCGVQTLHASGHAAALTATDVSERALALARATFALSGLDVEVLAGPWWEPVAGRRFDQVVCNPPFVPGPPEIEHVYRDAGLGGDGASALLVSTLPAHLAEDGVGPAARVVARHAHRRRGGPGGGRLAGRLGRAPPPLARRGRRRRPHRAGSTPGWCSATWPTRRCTSGPGCATPASTRPPPRDGRARRAGSTSSPSTTSSGSGSAS